MRELLGLAGIAFSVTMPYWLAMLVAALVAFAIVSYRVRIERPQRVRSLRD